VLVGAVTVLVVIVAVFLAYNANNGLPFVPTFELKAQVPSGAKLVAGNEVRDGGYRVGVVSKIRSIRLRDGSAGAELTMKLDKKATPIPADTTLRIRPRSALGLKYVELQRGDAADTLPDGSTIRAGSEALAPELQEFFNVFDDKTRDNVQKNLYGYGNGLAYRGAAINRAIESFPRFFSAVPPVMEVLGSREADIERFFDELGDAARVTAPVVGEMADGFRAGADTFDALSRDPQALKDTIAESPETLSVGTRSLRAQRPLLTSLVAVSGDLQGAAAQLRRSAPTITAALRSGVGPLKQLPQLNRRLDTAFGAVSFLGSSPGANMAAASLNESVDTLNPLLRYLGPFQTVCNHFVYSFTLLADHMTDQDQTGQVERVQAKTVDGEQDNLDAFGQPHPAPNSHSQQYGAAIDDKGNADCEWGQRGFVGQLAPGRTAEPKNIVIDPDTPGVQGTTYTGRARVPEGETFSRLPETSMPGVRP
jgi:virulence factor Mce-like protein